MSRVLIVEDDLSMARAYNRALGSMGYDVTLSNSPEDARKYVDREFDILILDGLNGVCFDLHDELNAKRKMIISGSPGICEKAKEKSIEAHQKPLNLSLKFLVIFDDLS